MEPLKEMQKWVNALSKSEKRRVTLLGKSRAGNSSSQILVLFQWLSTADLDKDDLGDPALKNNLPTVVRRLKALILDSLRLQEKDASVDSQLRMGLENASILMKKNLFEPAKRLLRQTKKEAYEYCRFAFALLCIQMERQILQEFPTENGLAELRSLRSSELACLQRLSDLQDLQYRYELLRTKSKDIMAPRNATELAEVKVLVDDPRIERLRLEGAFLEQALAVNILGIKDLLERNAMPALLRYQDLLKLWNTKPAWQIDQGALLYNISVMYLVACLYSPLPWSQAKMHLELLPDFTVFPSEIARKYQSTLQLTKFVLTLNTGNLDLAEVLISESDQWLRLNANELAPRLTLAFLHNFAIFEFILGNFSSANRFVIRILNMPKPNAREDIREFALVLQAVLQYEMGMSTLNEYLTVSGKRYFKKNSREFEFELAVFDFLYRTLDSSTKADIHQSLAMLVSDLDRLAENLPGDVPLLGLMEMRLWAKSKQSGRALRDIFLETVRSNLGEG